jgi:hypothetical protein
MAGSGRSNPRSCAKRSIDGREVGILGQQVLDLLDVGIEQAGTRRRGLRRRRLQLQSRRYGAA